MDPWYHSDARFRIVPRGKFGMTSEVTPQWRAFSSETDVGMAANRVGYGRVCTVYGELFLRFAQQIYPPGGTGNLVGLYPGQRMDTE